MKDDSSPQKPLTVKCPRCGTSVIYSTDNEYRPFCSERCKLIDLGQWANEDFIIPLQEQPSLDEFPDPDSADDFDA